MASSEFVAILDLLSWLAGTLAYKTDIAARENFLETAEARESILRLARFLSYNPTRSRPARSILKLIEVETSEDVRDSLGASLSNVPITWDDPDDPDWFERFITVLNAAMPATNPYGTPLKRGNVGGANAALYRLNGATDDTDLSFSAFVSGQRMDFEVVNGDFDEDGALLQRTPDPFAAMHIINLNDGAGNGSPRTGFFAFFKQGSTQRRVFQIDTPIENQLLGIDSGNITQDDIWVQTVADSGDVLTNWTRVPAVFADNITFNGLPLEQRNIYSVITGDDDTVTVRFSDGRFGNAPVGLIRVIYRVGNGLSYTIRSGEIERVLISLPYTDRTGTTRTLSMTFSLQETVSNATARETDEDIRRRAPLVYATQGRMVSGEDYNTFPLLTNVATRIKALNRVYSGQSRHVDRHDPTGTYSDVSVFGEDGILFREPYGAYAEVPNTLNRTPDQIVELHILPLLRMPETGLRVRTSLMDTVPAEQLLPPGRVWNLATVSPSGSTGWFSGVNDNRLRVGASLRFRPADAMDSTRDIWTSIVDLTNPDLVATAPVPGDIGPVTLSEGVPAGAALVELIPRYAPELQSGVLVGDNKVLALLDNNLGFKLWYDFTRDTADMWFVGRDNTRPADASPHAVRVLDANYVPYGDTGVWQLSAEGLRYVFESERRCEFYMSGRRAVDSRTGEQRADSIRVLKVNEDLWTEEPPGSGRFLSLDRDWMLTTRDLYRYSNGADEPRRIVVQLADEDEDGVADRPDAFRNLVAPLETRRTDAMLFWRRQDDLREVPLSPIPDRTSGLPVVVLAANVGQLMDPNRVEVNDRPRTVGYIPGSSDSLGGTFYVWNALTSVWDVSPRGFVVRLGRGANVAARDLRTAQQPKQGAIAYNWRHYAAMEARVDPAATNIHDIFVLGSAYDTAIRQWIARGATPADMPETPSELDLRLAFRDVEQFRMFSDQIVWRPVRYKTLFGPGAAPELRTQFKVVRLSGNSLTDGEIRSRVIRAVNDYFAASRWDFGETFFFTELAAFLHQQLAGVIGSVVIVPTFGESVFGDGFEIKARADEMFISTAQVSDVVLIGSNTPSALRSRR